MVPRHEERICWEDVTSPCCVQRRNTVWERLRGKGDRDHPHTLQAADQKGQGLM